MHPRRDRRIPSKVTATWLGLCLTASLAAAGPETVTLLQERCSRCHGGQRSENGLRLDSREAALRGGEHGPLFVPGQPSGSLLLAVLEGAHAEVPAMPKKGDRLTPAEVGRVRQWIAEGAPWPATAVPTAAPREHWAFLPVQRPALPPEGGEARPADPVPMIDAWVARRLTAEGWRFSEPADRVTLARRLSLDLLGLPPAPGEVDRFVNDSSPDALARHVNRLLDSPHYGERWARWWLDAARYADSNGFEKDRTRAIWRYRDWLIQAFNRDLPFDRFTIEQLAGDLLPGASLDQRIATGFLRNSMHNEEGGVEPEKFRTDVMVDRVDCVGRTWLGLTIACGQCHNHKYDPISQKEYYQFWAFLNNDDEPRIEVPTPAQAARRTAIEASVREFEDQWRREHPELAARQRAWEAALAEPLGHWTVLDSVEWHSTPMKFEKQEDLSFLGGGDIKAEGMVRVWFETQLTNITGFRLEAMTNANLPFGGPGLEANGTFQLAEFELEATPLNDRSRTNRIRFRRAVADAESPGLPAGQAIDGETTKGGWGVNFPAGRRNLEHRLFLETAEPAGFAGGTRFRFTLHQSPGQSVLGCRMIGRFRLSYTTNAVPDRADPLSPAQRALLRIPEADRTEAQQRELFRLFLFNDPGLADAARRWDELWKDWPAAETTLAMTARWRPRQTHILRRGDYLKPAQAVTADVPAVLHRFPADQPRNRLGLARWLVAPSNPLTARVIVNRVWQQYFGQGLVTTPEDFGTRADAPSHPEVLDGLAAEFMEPRLTLPGEDAPPAPWSMKHLHRLIVFSRTYRQSSHVTPDAAERDPANRWLSRGPRFRVDAEVVHDIALKASGLLSAKIGGPSTFPPLPDGVMQMSFGPIPWNVSEGEDRYRRAMYTFWKRSVPYPALATFDAPTAEQCTVRRARSNTPLQALTTLNEPTFHNAARWLAWRTLSGSGTDRERTEAVFRQCLGRRPEPEETRSLLSLLESALKEFETKPKDAAAFAFTDPRNPPPLPADSTVPSLAAWTAVARAVLNLDETITKE